MPWAWSGDVVAYCGHPVSDLVFRRSKYLLLHSTFVQKFLDVKNLVCTPTIFKTELKILFSLMKFETRWVFYRCCCVLGCDETLKVFTAEEISRLQYLLNSGHLCSMYLALDENHVESKTNRLFLNFFPFYILFHESLSASWSSPCMTTCRNIAQFCLVTVNFVLSIPQKRSNAAA